MPPSPGERPVPARVGEREAGPHTGRSLLFVLAAAVVVMAGLNQIGSLVGPVFLALTLALSARPISTWLSGKGAPQWLATAAALLLMYVVLVGMIYVIGLSVAQLAQTLPQYSDQFSELYQQVLSLLKKVGIEPEQASEMVKGLNVTSFLGVAQTLLSSVQSTGTLVLFVLLALAFLVLDLADVRGRAAVIRQARPVLADALEDFGWRVRKYWVYSAVFGLVLAACDYVALLLLGVPLALSWAILAFICNFVPNIGFALALIPPTLLALLAAGPSKAIAVAVAYALISFVVQTLMLPRVMGDAVGLNTTTTFFSLVFWSTVIGALGAVLAIPLTLFVKAVVIDSTPSLQWVAAFLTGEPDDGDTSAPPSRAAPST